MENPTDTLVSQLNLAVMTVLSALTRGLAARDAIDLDVVRSELLAMMPDDQHEMAQIVVRGYLDAAIGHVPTPPEAGPSDPTGTPAPRRVLSLDDSRKRRDRP